MNSQIAIRCVFLCTSLLITGCEEKNKDGEQTEKTVQVEEASDGYVIKITKSQNFPTVKAQTQAVSEELALNGSIVPDVSRTVAVNALSGGRIAEIHARLGDEVKKGQLLLKIHSPDLANAVAALNASVVF